jgi:CubicO group peptidase (beta-lactamase class C family)
MKKIILVFLLGYGFSCSSQQKTISSKTPTKESTSTESTILASMDENATTLLKKSKAYSVSIGIVKDGKIYTKQYGEIDKGKGNKATNETLFEIASVTKIFTGTLMAKAVLDGKINLNDDIRKYLNEGYPNLEYQGNPIKIKDLITHRSGILTPFPDTKEIRQKYSVDSFLVHKNRLDKTYTKNDFFAALRKVKVDTLPGTTFKYGALGPELCAHILENIYKKSYESQLKETIFDKSGMKSTKIHLDKNDILANGYNGNELLMANLSSNLWGASKMLKSTMADLIKFIKYELDTNNKVVTESHREIYANGGMGYFWEIQKDSEGNISYVKDGGSNGIQNILKIYPQYNLGFSIIINQSDKNSGTYLEEASEGLLDDLKLFDKKSIEYTLKK